MVSAKEFEIKNKLTIRTDKIFFIIYSSHIFGLDQEKQIPIKLQK